MQLCPRPFQVDFGPDALYHHNRAYNLSAKRYVHIGRDAGNMHVASKQLSIASEYAKISPSALLRKISITFTLKGAIHFELGALCRAGAVKQQWPMWTLWSKSDLQHAFDSWGWSYSVLDKGLSWSQWLQLLTMMTGQYPPQPPWDAQSGPHFHFHSPIMAKFVHKIDHGDIHSTFMQHIPHNSKQLQIGTYG